MVEWERGANTGLEKFKAEQRGLIWTGDSDGQYSRTQFFLKRQSSTVRYLTSLSQHSGPNCNNTGFHFGEGRLNSEYMHVIKMQEKASLLRSYSFVLEACLWTVQCKEAKIVWLDYSCRTAPFGVLLSPRIYRLGRSCQELILPGSLDFHLLLWEVSVVIRGRGNIYVGFVYTVVAWDANRRG